MFRLSRLAVLATALPLAGCVPTAAPDWLVQPADARRHARPPRYTTVTSGVKAFDVVDPKDWRELNRRVGPKPGAGGMDGMDHSKMPGMEGMPGMGGKRDSGGK